MSATTRRAGWLALVAVGVVAFALALFPGVATLLPVASVVAWLGNDYFLLGAFGGVALLVLGWMVARRATGHVEQAAPPDPEIVPDAPRPGERVDDLLGRWPWHLSAADRDYLRERLRTAAVYDQLGDGRSRASARERVESGAWTDDPVAARFLADESAGPTVTERLRLALRGDAWTQHAARTTARVLVEAGTDQTAGGDGR
ncbi:hypothetical protein EGH22_15845 [Halomicroarcula sp. F28]|uniref:DUF7269 family protein n=1 Tax=Haloarcula salinisoli TaxID=2487746 RepID=UPI001C734CED|nr:hypothetical protein [Halomicroarcula salinisoli]MBX0287808.1 hypothetical protein [Halomicroarcula salinisoli]